jgi:hypothetical protein
MATKKLKKDYLVRVRLTQWELLKLQSYADNHEKSMSEVLRGYIHRLPVQGELKSVITQSVAS